MYNVHNVPRNKLKHLCMDVCTCLKNYSYLTTHYLHADLQFCIHLQTGNSAYVYTWKTQMVPSFLFNITSSPSSTLAQPYNLKPKPPLQSSLTSTQHLQLTENTCTHAHRHKQKFAYSYKHPHSVFSGFSLCPIMVLNATINLSSIDGYAILNQVRQ